ncbi:Vascular endothelial growth factor A [Chionoecetes opilio]|uniref:Vascular endothelial growth factor A n=1 Tax=Chionoecetes opilio TaxID=41210 RepID=A0A8J5D194_CHIOP|nr:Vascular endothelial growth factor A [Chionoecetes opilio]
MRVAPWLALGCTLALAATGNTLHQDKMKRSLIFFPGDEVGVAAASDAALALPENLDLNELDTVGLSRVNAINNITDFAKLFGLELPEEDLVVRLGGASQVADMATCKTELQTVQLELPVEADTLYYPTCVRVEQCGGCCFGPQLTCRPTSTTITTVRVLKTAVGGSVGVRGTGRRRRRDTVPSYYEAEVVKHETCQCGCRVRQEDCNLNIHAYMESECACICKNKDAKAKCEQQKNSRYWDNDSCTCYCRRPVDCSSGEFFSQVSCT